MIEFIRYKADSGWSIIECLNKAHKKITVNCVQEGLEEGMYVEFEGEYVTHEKYGQQFKAEKYILSRPEETDMMKQFLGGGFFKGIGPFLAETMVDTFGKDTFDVLDHLEENKEKILSLKGMSEKKYENLNSLWQEYSQQKDDIIFLESLGLTAKESVKVVQDFPGDVISIIKSDPYVLLESFPRLGFRRVDMMARQLDYKKDAPERILYGLSHILKKEQSQGHVCMLRLSLIEEACTFLDVNLETITMVLDELIEARVFFQEEFESVWIYSPDMYFAEKKIAKRISELQKEEVPLLFNDLDSVIDTESTLQTIELSDEQKNSIKKIIQSPVSILTGGAGSGKTTTVNLLIKILKNINKRIMIAAPTGRAAQRVFEVTGEEAKTIHRTLVWDIEENGFLFNESNTLETDFLIIDESSMVDMKLMRSLLLAVERGTQVLFIGDPDQLPSVDSGQVLHSFIKSGIIPVLALTKIYRQGKESLIIKYANEIKNMKVPMIKNPFKNTQLFKEKSDCLFIDSYMHNGEKKRFIDKHKSYCKEAKKFDLKKELTGDELRGEMNFKIKKNMSADDIKQSLDGISPYCSNVKLDMDILEMTTSLYTKLIPKLYDSSFEVQILSPMKKGELGVRNLNNIIQEKVNPNKGQGELSFGDRVFRVGDKVIQTKNNYSLGENGVFNGDIGYILEILGRDLLVRFGKDSYEKEVRIPAEEVLHLDLAYAITIHKSQGSEFDALIIPWSLAHHRMLYNNLLYTAITRGKKLVIFVGDKKALVKASLSKADFNRNSNLVARLQNSNSSGSSSSSSE